MFQPTRSTVSAEVTRSTTLTRTYPVTYFSLGYSIDYHQATDEPQYVDYDHSARLGRWIHEIMTAIANRRDRPVIAGQDPAYPSCR